MNEGSANNASLASKNSSSPAVASALTLDDLLEEHPMMRVCVFDADERRSHGLKATRYEALERIVADVVSVLTDYRY